MRSDLLRLLADESEVTNVIILTHNIDFVFVQNLLLSSLAKCGSPSLTVFADAGCAAETFSFQAPLLSNLGRRYRVVPVAMNRGFRFHPKAVLLSGRKSARLFVGSGNLTFSGWRQNGEIWVGFRSEDGTAELSAFKAYLENLVGRLAINESLRSEIAEAFDPATRAWARELGEAAGLEGRLGSGPPLFERVTRALGGKPCDRLIAMSPYFDDDALVLRRLHEAMGSPPTDVFLDPDHCNLRPAAAQNLPGTIDLRPAWVERPDASRQRRCFLHAKLYAAERGDEVVALIGSANCSQAALTMTGDRGNAELMAAVRMSRAEFEQLVRAELVEGSPADLNLEDTTDFEGDSSRGPFLLAARAEEDVVTLALSSPGGFEVQRASLDDVGVGVVALGDGVYECWSPSGTAPRVASLEGQWQGTPYRTPPLWVDHESQLLSSSYRRSLDDTVRSKARKTDWDIGDWREVLEILCQDLEYTSPRRNITRSRRADETDSEERHFTREDLFSRDDSFHLPIRTAGQGLPSGATSLQTLLLRWFGHDPAGDAPAEPEARDESGQAEVRPKDEGDEAVDRAEQPLIRKLSPEEERKRAKREEKDRAKARKIVAQMAALMASPGYLSSRRLEDLGRDLQLAAVLLRLGSAKGWLDRQEVLATTHAVWTSLFLSAAEGATEGWIERRRSEDPNHAQRVLARPAVTAALFAWSLEIPPKPTTPREVQMQLALALSVARHPWLWLSSDLSAVAEEVEGILVASSESWTTASIARRWTSLQELGRELGDFEKSVAKESMRSLRDLNPLEELSTGELLWQGTLGYCVLRGPAHRSEEKNVDVLLVQTGGEGDTKVLKSDFLNPVRGLAGADGQGCAEEHLVEFLESLSRGLDASEE